MKRTNVDLMFDRSEPASFAEEKELWKKNPGQDT